MPVFSLPEASVCLKFAGSIPELIGSAFRTAFLLPKNVSTLPKMLVAGPMPIFVRTPVRAAVLLPKSMGMFTNVLIEALLRFG
jgi:hypothetical protein